jgi:hypothetical protein
VPGKERTATGVVAPNDAWQFQGQQAPPGSGTVLVIVESRSDGWMCVMSSLKKLRESASACVPVCRNGSLFGLAVHGTISVHLDL